jgi:hypothetical protein
MSLGKGNNNGRDYGVNEYLQKVEVKGDPLLIIAPLIVNCPVPAK